MSKKIKIVNENGIACVYCPTCTSYIIPSGSGLKCQKCELSIHTPCSQLPNHGYYLGTFDCLSYYENENEIFSMQLVCKPCLKGKVAKKAYSMDLSAEEHDENCFMKGHHIFENDNVVEAILNFLPINDLINLRLLNTVFNRNAVKMLSTPKIQSKLRPFEIATETKSFTNIVQNSQNVQMFRTIIINWQSFHKRQDARESLIDLVKFLKPLEIKLDYDGVKNSHHFWIFIRDLLPEMCENVSTFKINQKFHQDHNGNEPINWPEGLNFPKLKTFLAHSFVPEGLIKVVTKNSGNLKELKMLFSKDFTVLENVESIENFQIKFSRDCKILQMSRELLKVQGLKLKILKTHLVPCKGYFLGNFSNNVYSNEFSKFEKFLKTQSATLESLEMRMFVEQFHRIDSEELRDAFRLNFPKMENLKKLKIVHVIYSQDIEVKFNPEKDVWPIAPINLAEIFPKLNSIEMNYNRNWTLNFDTTLPCETVREISIDFWNGQSLREIIKIFPKIKTCTFLPNCNLENILSLYGWSETLTKIVIHFKEEDIFENFSYQKFIHFPYLTEIVIKGSSDYCAKIQADPPKPDFSPLNNFASLKKMSIRGFKNSEELFEILQIQCPNLLNK